jgi:hypothetical protein
VFDRFVPQEFTMANLVLKSVTIYNSDKELIKREWVKLEESRRNRLPDTETKDSQTGVEMERPPMELFRVLNNRFPGFEIVLEIIQHEYFETWLIKGGIASLIELFHISVSEDESAWTVRDGKWHDDPSPYHWMAKVALSPYPIWHQRAKS